MLVCYWAYYQSCDLRLLDLRTNKHLKQIAIKMSLIHIEVVTSEYVTIYTCIYTVQIYTLLRSFTVRNYLFISSSGKSLKFHALRSLSVRNFAHMRSIAVAKCWHFTMENVLQRSLWPRQVRVNIRVNVSIDPVLTRFWKIFLQKSLCLAEC